MGLFDSQTRKPTLAERLSDRVSIVSLLVGSGATFLITAIGVPFLSFGAFTARDEKGYIMGAIMFLFAICLLSGILFVVTILVVVMRLFQRD